jgi:hypothetical protein
MHICKYLLHILCTHNLYICLRVFDGHNHGVFHILFLTICTTLFSGCEPLVFDDVATCLNDALPVVYDFNMFVVILIMVDEVLTHHKFKNHAFDI